MRELRGSWQKEVSRILHSYDGQAISAEEAIAGIREHLDDITCAGQRRRFEAAIRFIYPDHLTPSGKRVLENVLADS